MKYLLLFFAICGYAHAATITSLTALTAPASGDFLEIVDVSDTSMSANGTNKKITWTNLLKVGSTTQAWDADLDSWALITRASGFDTFTATPSGANLASLLTSALPASKGGTGLTALSANVVSLLGAADYAALRALLDLEIGTDVQAYNATLAAIAANSGTVDLSGTTLTLGPISSIDATTEATIEAAIDTLANLTSVQGHTLTLTGALIRSGAHSLTLTTTGTTSVTLPTSGTLLAADGVGTALTALNGENIQDDTIDDDSIDFGTGADQVSAADIPIADTGSIFTATDVEAALLELAKVPVKVTATNYTAGTTDPREMWGGTIYVTGACTITLPAMVAGMSVSIVTIGAVAVSVDLDAGDKFYLDGTALSDGDKITNTSTAGDIAVITWYPTDGFYAATNSWTDGN